MSIADNNTMNTIYPFLSKKGVTRKGCEWNLLYTRLSCLLTPRVPAGTVRCLNSVWQDAQ